MSENDHGASPHPSPDDREKLATQILGGDTIHSKPQSKKFLRPLRAAGKWIVPIEGCNVEGQHLPRAVPLIFQGE